jgi:prepilin-type N-terminal cleavage/methylation domain-containing protein
MKNRGFTFVEILVTLLVLAVAVTPLLQLYATAVEQLGFTDDLSTASELAREEIEKVKNLALTERQLKQMGNVISPPIRLQKRIWYTVRVVDPDLTPLEVQVYVYRGTLKSAPIVQLVTIVNK